MNEDHFWYEVELHLIKFYGQEHVRAHLGQHPHCHNVRHKDDR